jgi:phosphatidate phosphatase PAH1
VRLALVLLLAATPAFAGETKPVFDDTRCATPPAVTAQGFRHKRSKLIAKLGSPNHRGIDLIASEDDARQTIEGKLAYGKLDKDVDKEDAELFACIGNAWKSLGVHTTDDDGRLSLTLEGAARLPTGMRDLYIAALGDGSGAYFVGYVAPRGTKVVITDVDGTLSWSENAIIKTVLSRDHDIKHRPSAPEALAKLPYPIVYTTARGDVFIDVTRKWLDRHGFPRGLLRLSKGMFAKPGESAIEYKTKTLRSISVPIAAGIGNRKSDITAYTTIGLAAKQIFIHLPEYAKEVKKDLDAGKATGFADYLELPKLIP